MFVNQFSNGAFRLNAGKTINRLTVQERVDSWQRLNTELAGNRLVLVDIDFRKPHLAVVAAHNALDHRRQLFTRAAPVGPEIYEHQCRFGRLYNVLGKGGRARVIYEFITTAGGSSG